MLLAFLLTLASQQPQEAPLDCDAARTTLEINECVARDLELEHQRMERYLAAAIDQVRSADGADGADGDAVVGEIEESQALWAAYADKACAAVYTHWQAGTIRVVMALDCEIELARQRSHHLWRQYLASPDSTPPVLPEPVLAIADERAPMKPD